MRRKSLERWSMYVRSVKWLRCYLRVNHVFLCLFCFIEAAEKPDNCVCFTNLSIKRSPLMKFYCGIDLSAREPVMMASFLSAVPLGYRFPIVRVPSIAETSAFTSGSHCTEVTHHRVSNSYGAVWLCTKNALSPDFTVQRLCSLFAGI